MRMDDIKNVITIDQCKSFGRAAAILRISQPALSQSIKRLEDELGCELFVRQHHDVSLTHDGEIFVREGAGILSMYSNLLTEIGKSNERYERIIVSASPMYSKHYFPPIYSEYTALYPHVELQLVEGSSIDRLKLLRNHDVDLVVATKKAVENEFEYRLIYQEEIVMAIPEQLYKKHSGAFYKKNGKEYVDLAEMQEEKFVSYQTSNNMCKLVNDLCREAAFTPNIIFRSSNPELLCTMVQCGMGVGFVPMLVTSYYSPANFNLHYCRVESKQVFRNYVLAYNSDALQSPGCVNYLDLAERIHAMGGGSPAFGQDQK